MTLSFQCVTDVEYVKNTLHEKLHYYTLSSLLPTALLNVTQNAEIIIDRMKCESKTISRRHTIQVKGVEKHNRVRSNGGHLRILRSNFDFSDHGGFLGQMNVYHRRHKKDYVP
jgi:hypothetical protein